LNRHVAEGKAHGIALMTLAMLTIPAVDGLAKYLSSGYSPLFIGWARYAVACAVIVPFAAARHGRSMFPSERIGAHLLRTVFLMIAMTLYFMSVARIPLATAATASFISPIVAVILAAIVLKERLTTRKMLSLILGFGGALAILRPGAAIEAGVLLALATGLFFAFYMIATRMASENSDPLKTLTFQCVAGTVLLTPQAVWAWSAPAAGDLKFFAAIGVLSLISHGLSIAAFRKADASTLAPLVYVELIGSTLIGYLVFGDVPGVTTWVGAGLIMAAGLMLVERRSEVGREPGA
jgi:drug/metabolite transporter (DMT)-like permease